MDRRGSRRSMWYGYALLRSDAYASVGKSKLERVALGDGTGVSNDSAAAFHEYVAALEWTFGT